MSTAKTVIKPKQLEEFMKKHGYVDVAFEAIEGGEVSQAYFFSTENGDKVLRFNSTDEGFQKDRYAAGHFASYKLPIPNIEDIGQLERDRYFAISERAPGKVLESLNKNEVDELIPQVIDMVEAIHATKPLGEGYGWVQLDGSGKYESWHKALDEMQAAEDDRKLASVPFFEPAYYDELRTKIRQYYKYCPDIRQLVHGDLSGNTLTNGKQITGVIDWHSAMYGDPLWDVAWLDFWGSRQGYAAVFKRHYENIGQLPTDFEKRITCYELIIAANSLAFFAKSGQPKKYDYTKQLLTSS